MAPIRRYLRISAYSVLEVRIYLDNPADAHRWLLRPSDPALPRIIQAVRPFVIPKLREENERNKKGGKKKGVKDVVHGDDFEVSIFLTELSTPHAILTKSKVFKDETKDGQEGSKSKPVELGDDDTDTIPGLRREVSDENDDINMAEIPIEGTDGAQGRDTVELSDDESDGADGFQTQGYSRESRASRRLRRTDADIPQDPRDDKKKLGFKTSYEGFKIYGRILSLVVKRKTTKRGQVTENAGQVMLENWIASTQDDADMLND